MHGVFQGSQPTREPTRSQAYQEIERDLKDFNACLPSKLYLEGMIDLSQDQTAPQLDLHHRPLRAPQVMQVEVILKRPECEFDIPSARI